MCMRFQFSPQDRQQLCRIIDPGSSPLATCGSLAERGFHRGKSDIDKCPWDFDAALKAGEVGPKGL
eukprot:IDg22259t1